METVTERALRDLVYAKGEWYVSIYMPTHPFGREVMQDVPRLKKLVDTLEKRLTDRGVRGVTARDFLKPILALPHENGWIHRSGGLAIFRSEKFSLVTNRILSLKRSSTSGADFM